MQSDNDEPLTWQEVYRRLIEEAPYIPGDAGDPVTGAGIKWANPKLIEQGQIFVKKNAFSVNLAHTVALLLGFSIKNLSTVLLRTGKFTGVINSMDRYIDTEDHLNNWYSSDIFHDYGDGHKNVQMVRRMHSMALKKCTETASVKYVPDETLIVGKDEKFAFINALRRDLEHIDTSAAPTHLYTYNPKVIMNQFDMALTQYGFFALMYMYPASFGIYDTAELDGFVHLWAVLGKLVGIQDRYNLALYPSRELCNKIHDQVGVACFKDVDVTTAMLMQSFSEAHGRMFFHGMSTPAFFYFSGSTRTSMPNFQGEHLYKLISWSDLIAVQFTTFVLFLMTTFGFINRLINNGFPVFVQWNRNKVLTARKLLKQKTKSLFN